MTAATPVVASICVTGRGGHLLAEAAGCESQLQAIQGATRVTAVRTTLLVVPLTAVRSQVLPKGPSRPRWSEEPPDAGGKECEAGSLACKLLASDQGQPDPLLLSPLPLLSDSKREEPLARLSGYQLDGRHRLRTAPLRARDASLGVPGSGASEDRAAISQEIADRLPAQEGEHHSPSQEAAKLEAKGRQSDPPCGALKLPQPAIGRAPPEPSSAVQEHEVSSLAPDHPCDERIGHRSRLEHWAIRHAQSVPPFTLASHP
jgi:hypothetical protein